MNLNDKFLMHKLPKVAEEKLNTKILNMKFIGGGSFGKVYKCTNSNNETIILKAYHVSGMEATEANQLKILGANTSVKMPQVYFTYSDDEIAVMCMSFIDGKNTLDPSFLLKSKSQKQKFANDVVDGQLQWHNVKGEKFGYLENATYDSWKEFYIENKVQKDLYGLKKLMGEGKYSKKITIYSVAALIFSRMLSTSLKVPF